MWYEALIYKLKQNGINDKLLCLLMKFLKNCQVQFSSWTDVNAGVPQGSIMGPLLLLIYINDLPNSLQSNSKLFADETSFFSTIPHITTALLI